MSYVVSKTHDKNFSKVCKQKDQPGLNDQTKQCKIIMHNFSSYSLTKEEVEALGLDQHISNYVPLVRNTIMT